MFGCVSHRLPKPATRCISSSMSARALQQPLATSSCSGKMKKPFEVSQGEKAWCDVYGVDYEKQIQEALHESPVAADNAPKHVTYPPAATTSSAKSPSQADIWNVVFGEKESST